MKILPDFLIIGASRCGTSSMFKNLERHPKILPSAVKEIHYFDNNFKKGFDWYKSKFPERPDDILSFEATPNYLFEMRCPSNCHPKLPDVKLIVMLRNPIERTWSQFYHCKIKGQMRVLKLLDVTVQKSMYSKQIKRWLNYYDKDRFLFIHSKDFFENPGMVLNKVFDFVGVERQDFSNFIYWEAWRKDLKMEPVRVIDENFKKDEYPKISEEDRDMLKNLFKPYNEKLYEIIGDDYGW